ncbi:hypothetical protein PYJP_03980 [Pyrofollis japonicus]|nr:hypothetical protein PYJP_03980 [Pyrofollis japonicus]
MSHEYLLKKILTSRLSGPEFVELMEAYGIRPKDLGITPNYKARLKKGERDPSNQLQQKLLALIAQREPRLEAGRKEQGSTRSVGERWPDPSLGELRGLADPTATPNAAGLTSGFDMSPGVARPLWPGRAVFRGSGYQGFLYLSLRFLHRGLTLKDRDSISLDGC